MEENEALEAGSLTPMIIGLLGGFIGSLFGIGGGSLMTPLMAAIGYNIKLVIPASLLAIVGTSLGGIDVYARRGLVNYSMALRIEPAAILGAIIASRISLGLPPVVLKAVLFAVVVYIAFSMARSAIKGEVGGEYGHLGGGEPPLKLQGLALLGKFLAGFLSALVGIGGGIITVPVLKKILRFDMKESVATAKLAVGITASAGAITYALHGAMNACLALQLGLGTVIGAYLGALTGTRVSSRSLTLMFSMLMIIIAVIMLVRR